MIYASTASCQQHRNQPARIKYILNYSCFIYFSIYSCSSTALSLTKAEDRADMSALYAHTPCLSEGFLEVSPVHRIFYQVHGQADGPAAVFLHGGPAAGCNPDRAHRFFDPSFYKIVTFDQRGSGRSEPNAGVDTVAAMTDNNTWTIVEDIEKLRKHLNIPIWHLVFGGSWGSTLALAYSQTHPTMVKSMVLRGIFLFLKEDMAWLFECGGASSIYPDKFEKYVSVIPEDERHNMIEAYYKRLTSKDEAVKFEAAKRFVEWEISISKVQRTCQVTIQYVYVDALLTDIIASYVCFYATGSFG